MNIFRIKRIFRGDTYLWWVIFFLCLLSGPIMLAAAGELAYDSFHGDFLTPTIKHLTWLAAGWAIMISIAKIPITRFGVFADFISIITLVLLVLAFVMSRGTAHTGRSIRILGASFQITEFAKVIIIFSTAYLIGRSRNTKLHKIKTFWHIVIRMVILGSVIFLSDFSTFALIAITVLIMMLVGRIPWIYIAKHAAIVLVVLVGLVLVADKLPVHIGRLQTIQARIDDFWNDDNGEVNSLGQKKLYQRDFSLIAINRGGVTGTADKSLVSNFLSAAYNDFVYAIINEIGGLVMGLLVLVLYIIFFIRSYKIMVACDKVFPAMLVCGLAVLYTFQAFINMGVAIGLVPVTGQPLPFISLGGSSVIGTSVAIGMIQSIAYRNKFQKIQEEGNTSELDAQIVEDIEKQDERFANLPFDDTFEYE